MMAGPKIPLKFSKMVFACGEPQQPPDRIGPATLVASLHSCLIRLASHNNEEETSLLSSLDKIVHSGSPVQELSMSLVEEVKI
eukprot:scaffold90392_cov82-Attheya_sp.AAC.1